MSSAMGPGAEGPAIVTCIPRDERLWAMPRLCSAAADALSKGLNDGAILSTYAGATRCPVSACHLVSKTHLARCRQRIVAHGKVVGSFDPVNTISDSKERDVPRRRKSFKEVRRKSAVVMRRSEMHGARGLRQNVFQASVSSSTSAASIHTGTKKRALPEVLRAVSSYGSTAVAQETWVESIFVLIFLESGPPMQQREAPPRFHSIFGLDLRSLALCRFLFGLVIIGAHLLIAWQRTYEAGDLFDRASDLQAHYSDTGVLPRTTVFNYFWNTNWISLHMMNGTARWEALLFWIHGIAAFCMAIGLYTKSSTVVSWFLLVSLHSRNPLVLHGGMDSRVTMPLTYDQVMCFSAPFTFG